MIFLYITLLILFLIDTKPTFYMKTINPNYLSPDTCTSIKGFCVILVFLSHGGKYLTNVGEGYINNMYYTIAGWLSQLIVVMFFFYSGYGMMEQLKRRGDIYSGRERLLD